MDTSPLLAAGSRFRVIAAPSRRALAWAGQLGTVTRVMRSGSIYATLDGYTDGMGTPWPVYLRPTDIEPA